MRPLLLTVVLIVCAACVPQSQRTLVVTDYVPAKQVAVPNLAALQQAANSGDATAQYNLGKLYAEGLGVPKSHRKAMDYWRLSAGQGYAPAQYGLGWMYFNGRGVVTDFKEGCKWMRSASQQGVQEATNHYNSYCAN